MEDMSICEVLNKINEDEIIEYKNRSLALGLGVKFFLVTLDIYDSFGYVIYNYNTSKYSLVLDNKVLLNSMDDIRVPEKIKIVHVINYRPEIEVCKLITEKSTIVLHHKNTMEFNPNTLYSKYLCYTDFDNYKYISVKEVDTFYLNVNNLISRERKYLSKIFKQVNEINNLILHVDEFHLNQFGVGCDVYATLDFVKNHLSKYIETISKLKIKYNIKYVQLKVSLSEYTTISCAINELSKKNINSDLTYNNFYDRLTISKKYGIYEDKKEIEQFISEVRKLEDSLNSSLDSNFYVEILI